MRCYCCHNSGSKSSQQHNKFCDVRATRYWSRCFRDRHHSKIDLRNSICSRLHPITKRDTWNKGSKEKREGNKASLWSPHYIGLKQCRDYIKEVYLKTSTLIEETTVENKNENVNANKIKEWKSLLSIALRVIHSFVAHSVAHLASTSVKW